MPEGRCRYSPDLAENPGRCFCLPSHGCPASSTRLKPPDGDAPPHCRLGRVHPLPPLLRRTGTPSRATPTGVAMLGVKYIATLCEAAAASGDGLVPATILTADLFTDYAVLRYHTTWVGMTWRHRLNSVIFEPAPPDMRGAICSYLRCDAVTLPRRSVHQLPPQMMHATAATM